MSWAKCIFVHVLNHCSTLPHVIASSRFFSFISNLAINAICSVLPLDFFEDAQAMYMAPQEGVALPPAGEEVISATKGAIVQHCGSHTKVEPIERCSFYEEAKTCFAVIQTMERRPYGNVILIKGCVGPDGNDLKP